MKDTSYVVNSSTSVGNFKYYDYGTLTYENSNVTIKSTLSTIGNCSDVTYVTDNVYCYEQVNGYHYSVHYIEYIDCWLGCRAYGSNSADVAHQYSQLHIFSRIQ